MIRILFDHEVSQTVIPTNDKLSITLELFRDFLYSRLKVLEDEINKEPDGAIVVNFFDTLKTKQGNNIPKAIHFQLFSDKLRHKLASCFSKEDERYIANIILEATSELN